MHYITTCIAKYAYALYNDFGIYSLFTLFNIISFSNIFINIFIVGLAINITNITYNSK